MGKALAAFLHGFQRRIRGSEKPEAVPLLKLRIMSPDKEFRGNNTKEINEFQK